MQTRASQHYNKLLGLCIPAVATIVSNHSVGSNDNRSSIRSISDTKYNLEMKPKQQQTFIPGEEGAKPKRSSSIRSEGRSRTTKTRTPPVRTMLESYPKTDTSRISQINNATHYAHDTGMPDGRGHVSRSPPKTSESEYTMIPFYKTYGDRGLDDAFKKIAIRKLNRVHKLLTSAQLKFDRNVPVNDFLIEVLDPCRYLHDVVIHIYFYMYQTSFQGKHSVLWSHNLTPQAKNAMEMFSGAISNVITFQVVLMSLPNILPSEVDELVHYIKREMLPNMIEAVEQGLRDIRCDLQFSQLNMKDHKPRCTILRLIFEVLTPCTEALNPAIEMLRAFVMQTAPMKDHRIVATSDFPIKLLTNVKTIRNAVYELGMAIITNGGKTRREILDYIKTTAFNLQKVGVAYTDLLRMKKFGSEHIAGRVKSINLLMTHLDGMIRIHTSLADVYKFNSDETQENKPSDNMLLTVSLNSTKSSIDFPRYLETISSLEFDMESEEPNGWSELHSNVDKFFRHMNVLLEAAFIILYKDGLQIESGPGMCESM